MKKIFIIITLFLVTILFLLGFIDNSSTKKSKSVADVVYSVKNIPEKLDKVGSLEKSEQDIICAVSRGLIELDSNGELIPSLVESIDIRDNGIEYDFKIRDDVYWSDGQKITPSDIAEFFREVILLEDEESIESLLNIFGVSEYRKNNSSFKDQVGIMATDTNLIIRLNTKDDNFLNELTKPQYRLRKNVLLWEDIYYNYISIPYSGNYSIADMNNNSEIVLIRNNNSKSKIARTIHIVKDENEDLALAAFEIGERDIVLNPPKSQLSRLYKEKRLLSIPSTQSTYLSFNKNANLGVEERKEIYSLITQALSEYESENQSLIKLAEGSYFRNEEEDLAKLQARKVMTNNNEEVIMPKVIYLSCAENVLNKDIVDYMSKWFLDNTDIELVSSLKRDTNSDDGSYYDVELINLNANHKDKNEFYQVVSPYLSQDIGNSIKNSNVDETEIISEIENYLFNNYSVLPLMFYNENIAINTKIEELYLDGNGNLKFEIIKK